jgi:tetratricopeptide (TPR) repeat protein
VDEVIRRIEKIISYDPNFEKAYQVGVMSLSIEDPEKAVAILDKACKNPQLKDKWKLPFYAGFILTHSTQKDKDEAVKKQKFQKAVGFYKEAIKRSANPETYVINSYLRALAKANGVKNEKAAMLEVLLKEWKASRDAREMETSIIPDVPKRILKAAQEARKDNPNDKEIQALTNQAIQEVFKDQHICMKCLTPYSPGDKFCSACGETVEVYGVCPKCKTVLNGKFCHNCGTPAPAAKKKCAATPKKACPAPKAVKKGNK